MLQSIDPLHCRLVLATVARNHEESHLAVLGSYNDNHSFNRRCAL